MQVASNSEESSTRPNFDKMSPFKVQMNLDTPNLEGKIDGESINNWVQQLESYYSVNKLFEEENITIASLKMSTSVYCWWENLSTKMEKESDPIDTWVKFVEYMSERSSTLPNMFNNSIRSGNSKGNGKNNP